MYAMARETVKQVCGIVVNTYRARDTRSVVGYVVCGSLFVRNASSAPA